MATKKEFIEFFQHDTVGGTMTDDQKDQYHDDIIAMHMDIALQEIMTYGNYDINQFSQTYEVGVEDGKLIDAPKPISGVETIVGYTMGDCSYIPIGGGNSLELYKNSKDRILAYTINGYEVNYCPPNVGKGKLTVVPSIVDLDEDAELILEKDISGLLFKAVRERLRNQGRELDQTNEDEPAKQ